MFNSDNLRVGSGEEAEIMDRIRISYIKNRGNSLLVTKDLKGIPTEYIYKVIKKLKGEDKRGMSNLVAEKVLEHLMLGYMTRTQYLFETVQNAEKEEKCLRSTCCKSRVREMDKVFQSLGETKGYECLECKKLADVYTFLDDKYLYAKLDAIEKLRKEDEALAKWLIQNKYTDKPSRAPIVVQDNSTTINNTTQIDAESVQQLKALGPLEQEALRLKIERHILDAEIISDENDPKTV